MKHRIRRVGLIGTAIGVCSVLGLGSAAFAEDGPSASPSPSVSSAPSVAAPTLTPRTITGQTSGTRTVVLDGTGLDDVRSISLGRTSVGAVRHLSARRIAVRIGSAPDFAPATIPVVLHRGSGQSIVTRVRFRFVATTFRARELRWAWAHLRQRTYTWGHSYTYKFDCANFTSHALVAAGMGSDVLDVSSTSLRRALLRRGATELTDTQANRARVRVGDVIQFDWHPSKANPGDRDHTGIVTGIARDERGRIVVQYSAHTDGGNNPSVQLVVEQTMNRPHHDPNGKVYFIHLPV